MGLAAGVLAAVLAADAGFEPVVVDVNHAAIWENLPDGGVSDVPRLVQGGSWADDRSTMLLGKSSARGTAERHVVPDASTETVTTVGVVMFGVGVVVGAVVGAVAVSTIKK